MKRVGNGFGEVTEGAGVGIGVVDGIAVTKAGDDDVGKDSVWGAEFTHAASIIAKINIEKDFFMSQTSLRVFGESDG